METPDVRKQLKEGFYCNTLPYLVGDIELRRAYRAEETRLRTKFKEDLFLCYGVTNNPKAERCFAIAWEERHSEGLHEVLDFFETLVELIK